ncbi:hypothetical protein BC830DRAFT_1159168 [Chytriomyces sp. MP71]|nr:hypothetical protein BC830DRAFT_1159168 [Chytriomyces sp. MP71]
MSCHRFGSISDNLLHAEVRDDRQHQAVCMCVCVERFARRRRQAFGSSDRLLCNHNCAKRVIDLSRDGQHVAVSEHLDSHASDAAGEGAKGRNMTTSI